MRIEGINAFEDKINDFVNAPKDCCKPMPSYREEFLLDEPVYSEPEQSVKLVLKNNIVMRTMRQADKTAENIGDAVWSKLDDLEKKILAYMSGKTEVTRAELCKVTCKSNGTISKRLNKLIELGVVSINGNKYDVTHTYLLNIKR